LAVPIKPRDSGTSHSIPTIDYDLAILGSRNLDIDFEFSRGLSEACVVDGLAGRWCAARFVVRWVRVAGIVTATPEPADMN
jgi:hypothetical protein